LVCDRQANSNAPRRPLAIVSMKHNSLSSGRSGSRSGVVHRPSALIRTSMGSSRWSVSRIARPLAIACVPHPVRSGPSYMDRAPKPHLMNQRFFPASAKNLIQMSDTHSFLGGKTNRGDLSRRGKGAGYHLVEERSAMLLYRLAAEIPGDDLVPLVRGAQMRGSPRCVRLVTGSRTRSEERLGPNLVLDP